jgi:hypothetical protein
LIPRRLYEVEKDDYDLCKLGKGEIAYKDIAHVEAMARNSSRCITREMYENNIIPAQNHENEPPKPISEYELWKKKKEFEYQIKQDMLN